MSGRRWLVALVATAVFASAVAGGYAYYVADSAAGSHGAALADALPQGNTPTLTRSGRDVTVHWAQNSPAFLAGVLGANAHGSYSITRFAENALSTPITPGTACSAAQAGSSDPLTCTESSLPTGRWKYTVTPHFYNWNGQESGQSASVTVAPAAPTAVTLANGGGQGSGYVNAANKSSINIDVGLAGTSLSSDTVQLTISDGSHPDVTRSVSGTAGAGTVHFTGVDLSGLDDGTLTFTAKATSSYGDDSGDTSNTYVKDTVAPAVTVTSPVANTAYNAAGWSSAAPIAGTATDANSGVAAASSIQVTVQSGALTWNGSGFASGSNSVPAATYSAGNWTLPFPNANFPADGTYTVSAAATDRAGNSGSSSAITFKYDTAAPAPTIGATTPSAYVKSQTPTIAGTAGTQVSDAGHSADNTTVTVRIYSGPNTSGTLLQTFTPTVASGSWTVSPASLPANAQYTVQVTQADGAGNSGAATKTFVIDTVNPVVTLTAPAGGSSGVGTTPTFSGTGGQVAASATTSADVATVIVYICTGSVASCNAGTSPTQTLVTTQSGGNWSVPASSALAAGTQYTAQAAQSDDAGNTGTSTANVFTTAYSMPFNQTAPGTYAVTVPAGHGAINYTTCGAGGAGSPGVTGHTGGAGGPGGCVTGQILVPSSGTTLTVTVGQGGQVTGVSSGFGTGGAGAAGQGTGGAGAGGGGASAIQVGGSSLVVAGAGGGGGGATGATAGVGGAGGTTDNGSDGTAGGGGGHGNGGKAGTTAAGAGGTTTGMGTNPGASGSGSNGGAGGAGSSNGGGGGGGGAGAFGAGGGAGGGGAGGGGGGGGGGGSTVTSSPSVSSFTYWNVVFSTVSAANGGAAGAAAGAGNAGGNGSVSLSFDTTTPTSTSVVLAGGGGGTAGNGDTTTITYSEDMDAATFCSTWVNDGTNKTATGTVDLTASASNSVLQNLSLTGCTTHFGSVATNKSWVTGSTRTYTVSVTWKPTADTLTITYTNAGTGGTAVTGVGQAIPSYTADTALTDLAGNAIGAGPYNGTNSRW